MNKKEIALLVSDKVLEIKREHEDYTETELRGKSISFFFHSYIQSLIDRETMIYILEFLGFYRAENLLDDIEKDFKNFKEGIDHGINKMS